MKSVVSRRAEEEDPLAKKAKKSVLAQEIEVAKESMNGSKRKKLKTTKKKNVSFDEESSVKKTKKSSLKRIKLRKVSLEMGRKDEEQLAKKKKKKKSLAKTESLGEEPVKKKKKKSLLTKVELGEENSSDVGELKRQKKKLSNVGMEPTAKRTKKKYSLECQVVSDAVEEPAKKKKKKKSSLDNIEQETSPGVTELKKKKKTSHIEKESPIKKTKKKKKSPLAKIEVSETPSEISKPRKKKKSSEMNEECVVKATKKRSMTQRELLEPTEKESAEKKKKKNGKTKKNLESTSDDSEPRKKNKLSKTEKEPITKKRKKSSLVLTEVTEPQESCMEMSGMGKEEESLLAEEPAELLGEMNQTREEMEVLSSEEESSENKTKESYSTGTESPESPEEAEVSYQGRTDSPQRVLVIQESWSQAVASIVYDTTTLLAPVTGVCGAKNSGKSTFCRFLLNNIIQRYGKVAYLETDVGQAEFTPPGFISLIVLEKQIPPFADLSDLCLEMPERWFFYGDISSKRDPNAYLKYVRSLYDYFHSEHYMLNERGNQKRSQLPLVVNTPGWVKGIGYDILVEMLKYIAPTHVVQIRVPIECKNLPVGAFWLNEGDKEPVNLFEIGAVYHDHSGRWLSRQKDSKTMREKKIFHYFRQCFPSSLNISSWKDLAHALASLPPYEVPLSSVQVRHLHCQVPSTEVLHTLNATIVGLAVSSVESRELELCTPLCVGLGIVRGIDVSKGLIYVLTPVPQSNLKNVDLLLQGYVRIPTYLLQVPGCKSPYMSEHVHFSPRP